MWLARDLLGSFDSGTRTPVRQIVRQLLGILDHIIDTPHAPEPCPATLFSSIGCFGASNTSAVAESKKPCTLSSR
jgi:hypothetical protein